MSTTPSETSDVQGFALDPRPKCVHTSLVNRLCQVHRYLTMLHLIEEGQSSGVYTSHNPKYANIRVAETVGGIGGVS